MNASEQLAAYRSDHKITIRVVPSIEYVIGGPKWEDTCATDHIRVLPVKGDRWRHHPDDIVALIDQEYGHIWPSQVDRTEKAAVEVARDIIREDLYPIAAKTVR